LGEGGERDGEGGGVRESGVLHQSFGFGMGIPSLKGPLYLQHLGSS
jgi:hypothetical protein